MPLLLDERVIIFEFADLWNMQPLFRLPSERYPGAHQSDILAYIARKVGWLKAGEKLEEEMPGRVFLGIMFEVAWFSLHPELVWQPGELVVGETDAAAHNGIAINSDGLGMLPDDFPISRFRGCRYVAETKCTEKKLRTGKEMLDDRMWMHQGRSYAHMYLLPDEPKIVQWTVEFYRGNWQGSGPVCMQYTILFTAEECAGTWDMLWTYKDEAMAALRAA